MTETIQDRLRKAMEGPPKISARALSLRIGRSEDIVRTILRNPGQQPRADTMAALAKALDVDERWLLTGEGRAPVASDTPIIPAQAAGTAHILTKAGAEIEPVLALNTDSLRQSMPQDLPVLGTAAGGIVGAFEFSGAVIEYVRRPPALATVPDAYAIYVVGTSMEPEHRNGALRIVHPHRPIHIGSSVILQVQTAKHAPIESYIAHLIRRSASHVVFGKLNPAAEVTFKSEHIRAIHLVLDMNELFGI